MPSMMKVKAPAGKKCPMEGNPRKYIEDTPMEVPNTAYYRKMLRDGSLIRVKEGD